MIYQYTAVCHTSCTLRPKSIYVSLLLLLLLLSFVHPHVMLCPPSPKPAACQTQKHPHAPSKRSCARLAELGVLGRAFMMMIDPRTERVRSQKGLAIKQYVPNEVVVPTLARPEQQRGPTSNRNTMLCILYMKVLVRPKEHGVDNMHVHTKRRR